MTIHAGGQPEDLPEWKSLGEAARATIIRTIADRATTRIRDDIAANVCGGIEGVIHLGVLMGMAAGITRTVPDGMDPDGWREVVANSLRNAALTDAQPLAINGCPLTATLSVPALQMLTTTIARAVREALRRAADKAMPSDTMLASALAAHSCQIAAATIQRAMADGWSADRAADELQALGRTTEAMVRMGMSGMEMDDIGEVHGNA